MNERERLNERASINVEHLVNELQKWRKVSVMGPSLRFQHYLGTEVKEICTKFVYSSYSGLYYLGMNNVRSYLMYILH